MSDTTRLAYVNAFIESVVEAFESMVGLSPRRTHVQASSRLDSGYGSSSVGAMVMTTCGPMILCFSAPVAIRIMSALTGMEVKELNNDVLDGTRELANILLGSANAKLEAGGMKMDFDLPETRLGAFAKVDEKPNDYWITVQFECEAGQFFVQVPFQESFFEDSEEATAAEAPPQASAQA